MLHSLIKMLTLKIMISWVTRAIQNNRFYVSDAAVIVLLSGLFLTQIFFQKPAVLKKSEYLPPPQIIQNLATGLQIQISDSLWLRALQDFDYCDKKVNEVECTSESWLYQIVDLTTDLDKRFRDAYFFGAMSLTVLISDYSGASQIFDKGILQFPNDWRLSYAAAYHALFEEKNKLKASQLYYAAAENGAPAWVHVLAGRLADEGGERKFAQQILKQMIENSKEPSLVKRLQNKLDGVKD